MGAVIRLRERAFERRLARGATRGVRPEASSEVGRRAGSDPRDRRTAIPLLGLREYWYPAIPAAKVGKKPLFWKMLGEELTFFVGSDGKVAAISDVCPHRGASLAAGACFYKGTVTCPYHGATFNRDGECVAFLTEGPASLTVGSLRVRTYPTVELRGWVFVWMGQGQPAPIEEDVPPEFFEPDPRTVILSTYTYWPSSWIMAIENQNDSHNSFFVHRNALMQLTAPRFRSRTPIGPRSKLVNDRALLALGENQNYYADDTGMEPYQLSYEGVGGVWPLHRWRKWVWKLFEPFYRYVASPARRAAGIGEPFVTTEEWSQPRPIPGDPRGVRKAGSSWHLPSAIRVNFAYFMYTRWAVPVDENTSRVVYFHARRVRSRYSIWVMKAWFYAYFNYWLHYNFSGQDARAIAPCRYWTPENLAATDSHLIMLRKLITERSRDAKAGLIGVVEPENDAERSSFERQREAGLVPETELEQAARARSSSGTAVRRSGCDH